MPPLACRVASAFVVDFFFCYIGIGCNIIAFCNGLLALRCHREKISFPLSIFTQKCLIWISMGSPPTPNWGGRHSPLSFVSLFFLTLVFNSYVAFSRQLADVPSPPVLIPVSGGSRDGQCARNQNFINLESGSLEIARHGFLDAKDVLLCVWETWYHTIKRNRELNFASFRSVGSSS